MERNVAGQKLTFFAFTPADGLPKTGDAANITIYVAKDDGAVTALTDTSAAEVDATNDKGTYTVDVAQAESNAIKLRFSGKSTTGGVVIVPQTIFTRPAGFSAGTANVNTATVSNDAITANAIAANAITDAKVASDVTIASVTGAVGSVTGAVGSVTGNVGGNVTGSVGSVVGAVGSVTGNVGGNVNGNVVGSVASVTAGVTVTTNNDKTGYSLSQSFPANFASLGINASGHVSRVTLADAITDKAGFTISGTTTTLDALQTALNSTHGAGSWATATGFSTHSAADVWGVATRVLTAGTNIQLPSNGLANVTAWTVNVTDSYQRTAGALPEHFGPRWCPGRSRRNECHVQAGSETGWQYSCRCHGDSGRQPHGSFGKGARLNVRTSLFRKPIFPRPLLPA
jgi:uncharacterized protein YjbJ (UPF0337 family)